MEMADWRVSYDINADIVDSLLLNGKAKQMEE